MGFLPTATGKYPRGSTPLPIHQADLQSRTLAALEGRIDR